MAAGGRQRAVGLATSIIQMGVLLSLAVLYVRFTALETRLAEHIRSTRNDAHQGEIQSVHRGEQTFLLHFINLKCRKRRMLVATGGGLDDAKCWPRE